MTQSPTHPLTKSLNVFAICLMALVGAVVVLYGTRWGPWAIEDTVDYFDVARNFAAGRGLVNTRPSGSFPPMHIHPPFYSMALAPAVLLGLDLLETARWLNACLFAGLILMGGLATFRLTRSTLLAIATSALLLTSTSMLNNYMGAMSEGLFFVLGFASLFLTVADLRQPRPGRLELAGLAAGLAFLTRFSGIAFAAAAAGAIFLWTPAGRARLVNLVRFGAPAVIPYSLWILYLRLAFPGVNPGYYDWQVGDLWEAIRPVRGALIDGLWRWFGFDLLWHDPPYRLEVLVLAGLLVTFLLFSAWKVRTLLRARRTAAFEHPILQLSMMYTVFAAVSLAMVAFTYVFVVIPKPWLDLRILSTVQTGLVLGTVCWLLFLSLDAPLRRASWTAAAAAALLIGAYHLPNSLEAVRQMHAEGYGYTSRAWRQSALIEQVRRLPPGTPLISNQPAPVFFLAGRPCYDLVSSLANADHPTPVTPYGSNASDPNQVLFQDRRAALILFDLGIFEQLRGIYGENPTETLRRLTGSLEQVVRVQDGAVYFP